MPRPFDVAAVTSAAMQEVFAAFSSRRYWLDRLAAYGGDSMTLDSLDVDSGGAVAVASTQDLRHDLLPGGIAKILPGDLKVLRTEIWRPVAEDRVLGEVHIAARGVPASGVGSAVLAPDGSGSRLTLSGTVEIKIPLVGGRIEKLIAAQIAEQIPEVQRFTTRWIADHG